MPEQIGGRGAKVRRGGYGAVGSGAPRTLCGRRCPGVWCYRPRWSPPFYRAFPLLKAFPALTEAWSLTEPPGPVKLCCFHNKGQMAVKRVLGECLLGP